MRTEMTRTWSCWAKTGYDNASEADGLFSAFFSTILLITATYTNVVCRHMLHPQYAIQSRNVNTKQNQLLTFWCIVRHRTTFELSDNQREFSKIEVTAISWKISGSCSKHLHYRILAIVRNIPGIPKITLSTKLCVTYQYETLSTD